MGLFDGKKALIFGVANRKSVAWHVAEVLREAGARCVFVVRDEDVRRATAKLLDGADVHVCNVEDQREIDRLRDDLAARVRAGFAASPLPATHPRPDAFADATVTGVGRMGKRLVLACDGGLFVVIHLMVAGRLRRRLPDAVAAAVGGQR